jgi:hypothetical protein
VKGIGIFVALLLIAGGVAMYVLTRPPDRSLDARGRAWVSEFSAWRGGMARGVDRAEVAIGPSTSTLSPRLTRPLETCSSSLAKVGEPPAVLEVVLKDAQSACGEIAFALSVYSRYGGPSLATVKRHLHRADDWLYEAKIELGRQLHPGSA